MHTPVLLKEVIECLKIQKDGVYLDLTVGYGFHAKAILEKAPEGFLVGIDKDGEALKHAEENLKKIGSNFKLIQGDFRAIDQLLVDSEHQKFDGVLGDLGVSSPQIDTPNRGFSYSKTGPLDMRMDQRQRLSAE